MPNGIVKKFGDTLFLPVVAAMASADTAATREATTIVLKVEYDLSLLRLSSRACSFGFALPLSLVSSQLFGSGHC